MADAARALGREARVLVADLSRDEEVDRLAAQVAEAADALEAVVHNAGIYERVPFASIDRARYRRMQAINLEAPFFLTQALLPLLERGERPSVIHVTDIAGERAEPGYAHYAVSKAGLSMLTRSLAVELAPRIRVNAIAPGPIDKTGGARQLWPTEEAAERLLRHIPLGRFGEPEEVAHAAAYLVSDYAGYVTGECLVMDGGAWLGRNLFVERTPRS